MDAKLPARPVLVKLRTGRRDFQAWLNGRPIAEHFSRPSGRGVRKLRASPTYGLRHGANRLHVRTGRGERKRSTTVRFRVQGDRPLAAAGQDLEAAAGSRVYLDSRRSLLHPRAPGRDGESALRYRWRVLKAPAGSSLEGAKLSRRHAAGRRRGSSPAPGLKLQQPGKYRLRLTVIARDGARGSDVADLRADPQPLVSVDTMTEASGGAPGIKVGNDPPYLAEAGTEQNPAWFQVLVLDRSTLVKKSNKTYFCDRRGPYPDGGFCSEDQLRADLAGLGADKLVIVANHSLDPSWRPPGYIPFARIGARSYRYEDLPRTGVASFSGIGVPGTRPGDGDWHMDPAGGSSGRMRGYLTRNSAGNYVFMPADRGIPFSTEAEGEPQTNVVQIGDQTFTSKVPSAGGGFHVVIVDASTLRGSSEFFTTSDLCREDEIYAMRDTLKRAADASTPKLVFVASRGFPAVQPCEDRNHDVNFALYWLAFEIEKLGGTRGRIFTTLDPGLSKTASYTLVGWSGAGPGRGEEVVSSDTGSDGINTVPATGTLARTGPNYTFEPEGAPVLGLSGATGPARGVKDMIRVAFQPLSDWPEKGDPGRTAAIKWIGQELFATSDPRSQYWTQNYAASTWNDYAFKIQGLHYPGESKVDFSHSDLVWARAELAGPRTKPPTVGGEIAWLQATHTYLEDLAKPFKKGQENWAGFQQIADSIRDDVQLSAGTETDSELRAVFDGFRELAGATTGGLYTVVVAVNSAYDTAMKIAEIEGKGADDPFQARADAIGVKFEERLNAAKAALTDQLPNVISADHSKLKTVGTCAAKDARAWKDCPFHAEDWRFTQNDKDRAADALGPVTRYWAYSALLPARYTLWRLPGWWRTTVNSQFYGFAYCPFGGCVPFDGLPGTAQMAKPIYRNIPTYSHRVTQEGDRLTWTNHGETWQIYALGYVTGSGTLTDRWVMHTPRAGATDPLFKPPPNGLGADPETFFGRYFDPRGGGTDGAQPGTTVPLDHYPERTADTAWCADPTDSCRD